MEVKIGKKRVQKKISTTIDSKKEMDPNKWRKAVTQSPLKESADIIDWSSSGKPFSNGKPEKNRPLMQIVISIAGALLIGTVMGISVLSLFFPDQTTHSINSIDSHLPAPIVKAPPKKQPAEMKSTAGTTLPTLHVTLLQAGNYQSKSSAVRVADRYRTAGFAAVMSDRAPYRIYLGIASNKADAYQLSKKYLNKGITVYVKEVSMSGIGKDVTKIVSALKIGNELFAKLQQLSVKGIERSGKVQVPAVLVKKQLAFLKASQISTAYPSDVRLAMTELARGLDQGVQGANELSKHPSATQAWFIQEGLIRYASGYEQLIDALSHQ
jgi:stage II sporulation protein B